MTGGDENLHIPKAWCRWFERESLAELFASLLDSHFQDLAGLFFTHTTLHTIFLAERSAARVVSIGQSGIMPSLNFGLDFVRERSGSVRVNRSR